MHDKEALEMMGRCREEIISLRGQIAALRPKADAYDNIASILRLLPQPSVGMGEDLVWRINKRIEELRREIDVQNAVATPNP